VHFLKREKKGRRLEQGKDLSLMGETFHVRQKDYKRGDSCEQGKTETTRDTPAGRVKKKKSFAIKATSGRTSRRARGKDH